MSRVTIANYLGAALSDRLSGHASQPRLLPIPANRPPWEVPAEAEILITSPSLGWKDAPSQRPDGWPRALKWIQLSSTGIDTFPTWLLEGPMVTCSRGLSAVPIAEYVMAAILENEKRLSENQIRDAAQWRPQVLGLVAGKTIGLFGFGTIGQEIARRARAFGMTVMAHRRVMPHESVADVTFQPTLTALLAAADYLVLAAPLTSATLRIINADTLRHAKPGMHLINVARGPLVDHQALLAALDDHLLSGATLDVTDPEPLPPGHPLYTHPAVRITPHVSYSSEKHFDRLADMIVANLDHYLAGRPLTGLVDMTVGY
jgi:phosphoglycerate dehydrogenase-like enzyme